MKLELKTKSQIAYASIIAIQIITIHITVYVTLLNTFI